MWGLVALILFFFFFFFLMKVHSDYQKVPLVQKMILKQNLCQLPSLPICSITRLST